MRQFNLVSVALFSYLASQALADPLDDAIVLFRRQSVDISTGVSSTTEDPAETTTEASNTPTPITTPTTTTANNPAPSTVDDPDDDDNQAPASTVIETSTSTRENTEAATTDANNDAQDTAQASEEAQTTSRTRITSSFTSQILTTFTTVTDGRTLIGTSTSETVMATETDVDPSSLSDGGSSGGSSGLSDSTKKTIGGVVGGIGGALLLAGLAYTAWRVWGKKKNLHDDDLYDPNMGQEKLSSSTADNTSTATPFNRTLDQYHNPGPVNQASNF